MITIISCSQRTNSQSVKVSKYIENYLKTLKQESTVIDLAQNEMPFFGSELGKAFNLDEKISTTIKSSTGFVFCVPEWNGTLTPILTNFILWLKKEDLAHKPVLIVTISSNLGGALIVNQIRSTSYKNTLLNYIPEHVIIRDVKNYFNEPFTAGNVEELPYIQARLHFALNILLNYAVAMTHLRTDLLKQNYYFLASTNGMS